MKYSRERPSSVTAVLQLAICLLLSFASMVSADELAQPEGEIILFVKGNIVHTNAPGMARFDYAMLVDLGLVSEQIDTEWTPAGAVFEGIRTRSLLEAVGATGRRIRATAVNDYSVSIPFEDLAEHDTLLAFSRDGKRLRLRDQGPLWLVYVPHDQPDEIQSILNHRMVWQLQTLDIE